MVGGALAFLSFVNVEWGKQGLLVWSRDMGIPVFEMYEGSGLSSLSSCLEVMDSVLYSFGLMLRGGAGLSLRQKPDAPCLH